MCSSVVLENLYQAFSLMCLSSIKMVNLFLLGFQQPLLQVCKMA